MIMTTIINSPGREGEGGLGLGIGLVVAIGIIVVFAIYGWPALRDRDNGGANVDVPAIEVDQNQTSN